MITTLAIALLAAAETAEPVNVGNTTCPVSGKKIEAAHIVDHNGKQYNLCSKPCTVTFAETPEKYSEIAENETNPR